MGHSSANRFAIVLCTDRNMMIPALFVAHSIIRHSTSPAVNFDLIVVTNAQAASDVERDWMSDHGILHEVIDFAFLQSIFGAEGRLTSATLVKLTLAHYLSDRYDRILYLDCDLTIHTDLSVLFNLNLGGHAIAANRRAVLHRTQSDRLTAEAHFTELGMTQPFRYFNSGVMLIDVVRWNEEDLTCKSLDYIALHREICPLADEDGLNAVLNGRFAALSPAWNMPPRRAPFMDFHDLIEAAIVHYTGLDKPWKRFGRAKPLFPDREAYTLYRDFIAASPWKNWLRQQWNIQDLNVAIRSALRKTIGTMKASFANRASDIDPNYLDRIASYLSDEDFSDVEHGLVLRNGPHLRLKR